LLVHWPSLGTTPIVVLLATCYSHDRHGGEYGLNHRMCL
jgi:hypothetical protein